MHLYLSFDVRHADNVPFQSTDADKTSQATWGRLACEILGAGWDAAMEEVIKIKDLIEQKVTSANHRVAWTRPH